MSNGQSQPEYVFVGGLADGQRREMLGQPETAKISNDGRAPMTLGEIARSGAPDPREYSTCTRRTIYTNGGEVTFYAERGLNNGDALRLLLAGYTRVTP